MQYQHENVYSEYSTKKSPLNSNILEHLQHIFKSNLFPKEKKRRS